MAVVMPSNPRKPVIRASTFNCGKLPAPVVRKTCVPRILSKQESSGCVLRSKPLRSTSSAGQLMDTRKRASLIEPGQIPLLWKFGVLLSHSISKELKIQSTVLAEGAFAAVFSGKLIDNRNCVIKVPHERFCTTEYVSAIRNNFENEVNILSQLHHPNIVSYLAVFKSMICRCPLLILEEMDCNLTELLTMNDDIDVTTQLDICNDISSALVYLHRMDIIHGNITSNNVLIALDDDKCTAKLCDFMHAKTRVFTPTYVPSYEENSSIFFSSPEYFMCPEPQRLTKQCDIFACGVVFLHVGTQRPPQLTPMWSESPLKMKATRISEMDRRKEHISCLGANHPLKSLIISCLQDHPAKRPEAERLSRMVQAERRGPVTSVITSVITRNDCYESSGSINRLSVHPFYNDDGCRSISAPLYCKMRIRASSVTSSTSSWSFMSTSQQVFSESSQSDNSEEQQQQQQQIHTALNNRNAFSEARLPNITHMNNLHDRHQRPNKTTKVFRWKSLLPFGRGKKSSRNGIEKQNITNPTNFRKIASATSDSNVMTSRCLDAISSSQWV